MTSATATSTATARRRAATRTFDELVAARAPWEAWEAFAARAGVSSRRIRQLRAGDGVRPPYRGTVDKLAAALGVTAETVYRAIDETRRETRRITAAAGRKPRNHTG